MDSDDASFTHNRYARLLVVKSVTAYGRTVYEPLNDLAERFVKVLDQTVFSREDLTKIKTLDYLIKVESEEI